MTTAIQNGYITTAELKTALDRSGQASWGPQDDQVMAMAIEAASRYIDRRKGTEYFVTSAEARYFTARHWDKLWVDDFTAITSILLDEDDDGTYEITMTASDYQVGPINAAAKDKPYTFIRITTEGDYRWPVGIQDGVKVTADWGYNSGAAEVSAPAPIRQACLLLALRLYKRKDTIWGVAGSPALAGVQIVQAHIREDRDVQALLDMVPGRLHYG